MAEPSQTAADGRDQRGRFASGNRAAKGNPMARKVASIRRALFAAVRPADIRDVVAALLKQAKAGEVAAIKELFDRLLGKATVVVAEPENPEGEAPDVIQFVVVPVPADEEDGQSEAGSG